MAKFNKSHLLSKSRRQDLRARSTVAETKLWPALKAMRKTGYIFRRQHSLGWYIADFYCAKARLVIEIDGGIHDYASQKSNDKICDSWMCVQGIRVLRFKNEEIEKDLKIVLMKIMGSLI